MKCLFAVLALFLAIPGARAAAPHVTLRHLTGPIYLVEDTHYFTTNSLVYVGPRTVTVVGATWTPQTARALASRIAEVTKEPVTEVIDNDYNPEYAGGNAYWKGIGARVVSTQLTCRLMRRDWTGVGDLVRRYFPSYPHVPPTLPTATYPGSFDLQEGKIRVLYLGPSHTPDDVFVYFPNERVLYAGSILKEHLGNMAFADVGKYESTLRRLQRLHLDIRTIVSGHWSALHGPELIDRYLEMLEAYSSGRHAKAGGQRPALDSSDSTPSPEGGVTR